MTPGRGLGCVRCESLGRSSLKLPELTSPTFNIMAAVDTLGAGNVGSGNMTVVEGCAAVLLPVCVFETVATKVPLGSALSWLSNAAGGINTCSPVRLCAHSSQTSATSSFFLSGSFTSASASEISSGDRGKRENGWSLATPSSFFSGVRGLHDSVSSAFVRARGLQILRDSS